MIFGVLLVVSVFTLTALGWFHLLWLCCGKAGRSPVRPGCLFVPSIPVVFWLVILAVDHLTAPVRPSRDEITGMYEIDRNFHPGPQADWQHDTYSLEILPGQVILRDRRTPTVWRYEIDWFTSPEYRWKFSDSGPRHHLVSEGPAIIREWSGYFYVFESPLYGEVVFRKRKAFPWRWFVGLGVPTGLGLAWWSKRFWQGKNRSRSVILPPKMGRPPDSEMPPGPCSETSRSQCVLEIRSD